MKKKSLLSIQVAARDSPLSRAQVNEVLLEVKRVQCQIEFIPTFVLTTGDLDQMTSLRELGKTDFFTKEVDNLILTGKCHIAIHSAKDLPEPLPTGLMLIALTKGIDSSDSLVLRNKETLETLPSGAIIATSSERREESVKQLRPDFTFKDLRGTIHQRLAKLDTKEVDGVVIAEAALIRLGLTNLNRITLPGPTAPFQGQLAIIAKEEDEEMRNLFKPLCSRKSK